MTRTIQTRNKNDQSIISLLYYYVSWKYNHFFHHTGSSIDHAFCHILGNGIKTGVNWIGDGAKSFGRSVARGVSQSCVVCAPFHFLKISESYTKSDRNHDTTLQKCYFFTSLAGFLGRNVILKEREIICLKNTFDVAVLSIKFFARALRVDRAKVCPEGEKGGATGITVYYVMRKLQQVCLHLATDLLSTSRYQDAFAWFATTC